MPASDNDVRALKAASAAVTAIDVRYRQASLEEQEELAKPREQAWVAYSLARQRFLEPGVLVSDTDLADLENLSAELAEAARTAAFVGAALKIASLLGRLALA